MSNPPVRSKMTTTSHKLSAHMPNGPTPPLTPKSNSLGLRESLAMGFATTSLYDRSADAVQLSEMVSPSQGLAFTASRASCVCSTSSTASPPL